MGLEKSCEFYDHSRCLLKNNYCDLNCSRVSIDEKIEFYEEDVLKKSRGEEKNGDFGCEEIRS
ncbi:MAG: hypothetical protein ACUVTN_01315 [Thermodesulfobacteriota bacterium]